MVDVHVPSMYLKHKHCPVGIVFDGPRWESESVNQQDAAKVSLDVSQECPRKRGPGSRHRGPVCLREQGGDPEGDVGGT